MLAGASIAAAGGTLAPAGAAEGDAPALETAMRTVHPPERTASGTSALACFQCDEVIGGSFHVFESIIN